MSRVRRGAKKIDTTLKIFVFCFLLYLVNNVYSK